MDQLNRNSQFLSIPVELIVDIFSQLSSLDEVLSLAASCIRLRLAWHENPSQIYAAVGSGLISCEKHALQFLSDKKGTKVVASNISAKDVLSLLRNSRIIENAIPEFEKGVVTRVKSESSSALEVSLPLTLRSRGLGFPKLCPDSSSAKKSSERVQSKQLNIGHVFLFWA
jgi:hypothetical protein